MDSSFFFSTFEISVAHTIMKKKKAIIHKKIDYDQLIGLFIPSLEFLFEYISLILFSILTMFFFYRLARKQGKIFLRKFDIFTLESNLNNLTSTLRFMVLFFILLMFFVKFFIASNIKTSKVNY